jgi:citrate synthase
VELILTQLWLGREAPFLVKEKGSFFKLMSSSAVIDMIKKIATIDDISSFLDHVVNKTPYKNDKKAPLLQGFGHRVYKSIDPRVKMMKDLAFEVF